MELEPPSDLGKKEATPPAGSVVTTTDAGRVDMNFSSAKDYPPGGIDVDSSGAGCRYGTGAGASNEHTAGGFSLEPTTKGNSGSIPGAAAIKVNSRGAGCTYGDNLGTVKTSGAGQVTLTVKGEIPPLRAGGDDAGGPGGNCATVAGAGAGAGAGAKGNEQDGFSSSKVPARARRWGCGCLQ